MDKVFAEIKSIKFEYEYTDDHWNHYEARCRGDNPSWKIKYLSYEMYQCLLRCRRIDKKNNNVSSNTGFWRCSEEEAAGHSINKIIIINTYKQICSCYEYKKSLKCCECGHKKKRGICKHIETLQLCRYMMYNKVGEINLGNTIFGYLN